MVLVESNGLMVKYMKDIGEKESKMEKEKLEALMEYNVREYGKMAKESNDNFFYFNILFWTISLIKFNSQIELK